MKKVNTKKLALWQENIEACKASNLSVSEWCKEQGVTLASYYYWHSYLTKQGKLTKKNVQEFVEVPLQVSSVLNNEETAPIKLHYKDFTLDIPQGTSLSSLTDILAVLKNIC